MSMRKVGGAAAAVSIGVALAMTMSAPAMAIKRVPCNSTANVDIVSDTHNSTCWTDRGTKDHVKLYGVRAIYAGNHKAVKASGRQGVKNYTYKAARWKMKKTSIFTATKITIY
jgi:hypothetical protein